MLFDILSSVGKRQISMLLALADLIAAFYTVDHSILINRLSISFGHTDACGRSSSVGRRQLVDYTVDLFRVAQYVVPSDVAQGSVLGPLLFVLYTADIQISETCVIVRVRRACVCVRYTFSRLVSAGRCR